MSQELVIYLAVPLSAGAIAGFVLWFFEPRRKPRE